MSISVFEPSSLSSTDLAEPPAPADRSLKLSLFLSLSLSLNQDGKSALHCAANNGSADVAKMLVDANANLELVDKVSASGVTTEERHRAGGGG
jgi:ankyrin repeat protein